MKNKERVIEEIFERPLNNELTHYGVPGMKWGKRKLRSIGDSIQSKKTKSEKNKTSNDTRRTTSSVKKSEVVNKPKQQNSDNKGVRNTIDKYRNARLEKKQARQDSDNRQYRDTPNVNKNAEYSRKFNSKKSTKKAYNDVKKLSDEELNYRINRLSQEKRYKELSNQSLRPGRTALKKTLGKTALGVAGATAGLLLYSSRNELIKKGSATMSKYSDVPLANVTGNILKGMNVK